MKTYMKMMLLLSVVAMCSSISMAATSGGGSPGPVPNKHLSADLARDKAQLNRVSERITMLELRIGAEKQEKQTKGLVERQEARIGNLNDKAGKIQADIQKDEGGGAFYPLLTPATSN